MLPQLLASATMRMQSADGASQNWIFCARRMVHRRGYWVATESAICAPGVWWWAIIRRGWGFFRQGGLHQKALGF
jgi:hypothetical protein